MNQREDQAAGSDRPFVFPSWANALRVPATIGLIVALLYLVVLVTYGASPQATDVGYAPKQPVEYSHALHPGKLGLDCRYCHNTVEVSAHAAIPPTDTCMNCHAKIRAESPKLIQVRESHATGMPIEWVRVHDLPDYVYFNHSAHVRRGIGCASCHDRVDKMDVVYQAEMLSMGWCLDCHRNPELHLRPVEFVTQMDYALAPDEQRKTGARLRAEYNINPSTNCSTCHR